jgi:ribosome-associated translation inhibitor RaiA
MTIEFHTPYGKVTEKLVNSMRNDVMELAHINKKITRAEVLLKEHPGYIESENKICEIRLNIYGNDLFVHTRTENFENSAKDALKDLRRLVRQQAKKQKELPDQEITTVKV